VGSLTANLFAAVTLIFYTMVRFVDEGIAYSGYVAHCFADDFYAEVCAPDREMALQMKGRQSLRQVYS